MSFLRFFLTALFAVAALVAGLLAAAAVIFTSVVKKMSSGPRKNPQSPAREPVTSASDVIDIEATVIPSDPVQR